MAKGGKGATKASDRRLAKGTPRNPGDADAAGPSDPMELAGVSLPAHLEEQRGRVQCDMDAPKHTSSVLYGGAYWAMGQAAPEWSLPGFKAQFCVQVQSMEGGDMVFDLVGLDPALANALRRILIAEVPTVAIEKVFIADNTSLIQDEVLAHRLGLVPLRVDPHKFEFLAPDGLANETNTVVFKLSQKCTRTPAGVQGARVLASMLEWQPGGSQYPPDQPDKKFTTFSSSQDTLHDFAEHPPVPTNPDIVLAKLSPGQAIELEAHAVKGVGKTHAKWSPVATASYKMLPEVRLRQPVEGADAEELVRKCPKKVFDIEDVGGVRTARVVRARECTLCRECIRTDDWAERVQLTRVKTHFVFSIESTGSLPPNSLFMEAITILKTKASKLLSELS